MSYIFHCGGPGGLKRNFMSGGSCDAVCKNAKNAKNIRNKKCVEWAEKRRLNMDRMKSDKPTLTLTTLRFHLPEISFCKLDPFMNHKKIFVQLKDNY